MQGEDVDNNAKKSSRLVIVIVKQIEIGRNISEVIILHIGLVPKINFLGG